MAEAGNGRDALAGSGVVFVVLFGVGIFIADLRAAYPGLSMTIDALENYFAGNRAPVRALGFLHALAALALLVFTSHVSSLMRRA